MTAGQDRLMMDNPKDVLKPVYGPDDLQAFASILKIDTLNLTGTRIAAAMGHGARLKNKSGVV